MWTELTGEQIGQERMRFFERLKAAASAEWRSDMTEALA